MKHAKLPHPFKIVETKPENEYTKTFILDGALQARPGQFVMVWLPEFEDKPFSLANADPLSLTIAAVGSFTRALHQLQVGHPLWVRGPLGRGYQLPKGSNKHVLLIGGGYGVAPLLFLARRALAMGHRASMIIGARTDEDLLLAADFKALGVPVAACQPLNLPVQVAWEAHMRCGIGLCGSCEAGQGWLTCLDGPVFTFDPLKTPPPELKTTERPPMP